MSVDGTPTEPVRKLECGIAPYITAWSGQKLLGPLLPFGNSESSAIQNYNYKDFSAHPVLGPQGQEKTLSIFFFQGTEGLSFNLILDKEMGEPWQSNVVVNVTVRKNQLKEEVIFSDEADEFQKIDADLESTFFRGVFNYKLTTDGAIIGPLIGRNFEIEVSWRDPGPIQQMQMATVRGKTLQQSIPLANESILFKVADIDPCLTP